jgi:single-strand DNA-binding protein
LLSKAKKKDVPVGGQAANPNFKHCFKKLLPLKNDVSMIKLQVIGNLGKDALLNQVNGKNVINFTVAHTERYRDSAGVQKEKTTWVECAYWTDRTGVVPYLKRGSQVYVEGTPEIRQFTRTDGTPGSSLSLRVMNLQLVGVREGSPAAAGGATQPYQPAASPSSGQPLPTADMDPLGDDLPF